MLLHLFNGLLLLFLRQVAHTLFVPDSTLDFNLKINGAVADLTIGVACSGLFVVDVVVNFFFLLLVLISGLLLSLNKFDLLAFNLALSLLELHLFLEENSAPFR